MRELVLVALLASACRSDSTFDKGYFYDEASGRDVIPKFWSREMTAVLKSMNAPPLRAYPRDEVVLRCTVAPSFSYPLSVALEVRGSEPEGATLESRLGGGTEEAVPAKTGLVGRKGLSQAEMSEARESLPGLGRVEFPSDRFEARSGADGAVFLLELREAAKYRGAVWAGGENPLIRRTCEWLMLRSDLRDDWRKLLARE